MSADFDDDWIDIDGLKRRPLKATVEVALSRRAGAPTGGIKSAQALVWLRYEAAEWAATAATRFTAQLSRKAPNRFRIVPDERKGRFKVTDIKGTSRLCLGVVQEWPDVQRAPIEASFTIDCGCLVVTLPPAFLSQSDAVADPVMQPEPKNEPICQPEANIRPSNDDDVKHSGSVCEIAQVADPAPHSLEPTAVKLWTRPSGPASVAKPKPAERPRPLPVQPAAAQSVATKFIDAPSASESAPRPQDFGPKPLELDGKMFTDLEADILANLAKGLKVEICRINSLYLENMRGRIAALGFSVEKAGGSFRLDPVNKLRLQGLLRKAGAPA